MTQAKWIIGSLFAVTLAACNSTGERAESGANHIVNDDGEITHICRKEKKVGTNFSERVCRTVAEMEQMGEDARQDVERAQRSMMDSRNY